MQSLAPLSRANKRTDFRVSLVIPALNEEGTICQALCEADIALSQVAAEYEIIAVDDGSSDSTGRIALNEAAKRPRVRLLQHSRNQGYGAALRTGFQAARFELVAFTDADCQFDLTDLIRLLPLTRRYDLVCGRRLNRQDSLRRRFLSWGYNRLVRWLLRSPVRDIDCAFKVFHRKKLKAILPDSDDFFVNAEMLTKAHRQGMSITEIGVRHRPRAQGRSKVSWRAIPRTLKALLSFWWRQILFPRSVIEARGWTPSGNRAEGRPASEWG